jgi:hypothetical protein
METQIPQLQEISYAVATQQFHFIFHLPHYISSHAYNTYADK